MKPQLKLFLDPYTIFWIFLNFNLDFYFYPETLYYPDIQTDKRW